jgi:hypothetical protein
VEQLSIGAVDKKRDFCASRVFNAVNFFVLLMENPEETALTIGSIPAHFFSSESIASSAKK